MVAEDGIRDKLVTGVQTCALPILAMVSGLFQIKKHDFARRCRSHFQARFITHRSPIARHQRLAVELQGPSQDLQPSVTTLRQIKRQRSEERRVGKECKSRW